VRDDVPRWVEGNALLADPTAWRAAGCVGSDADQLIVAIDEAVAGQTIATLAARYPAHAILTPDDAIAEVLRRSRHVGRALLHVCDDPDLLPDPEGIVVLPRDADLSHLDPALAAELTRARGRERTIHAALVDDVLSAFAYAPWRTPAWFDVSVDVIPAARQLGLGTLVAAAMIRAELALGRAPVWGADEGNLVSLRIAARLGFRAVDHLYVAAPSSTMPA